MTILEKMNIIKDSINNIINRIYGVYENGIITRIVNDDNPDIDELSIWYDDYDEAFTKMLENPNDVTIKYEVAISYNDKGETDISSFDNTTVKYAQNIIKTLTGIDPVFDFGYDSILISDLYNKLLEIKDYTDEELKLYFKLLS